MTECSACGAELKNHQTRCPFCGKPTVHYHRQRRCLHCGTPAAEKAETCMACGKPVDGLPLKASFSGSWWGVALGVVIIVGLVVWINSYQPLYTGSAQADQATPTHTATVLPRITPTSTATLTPLPPTVESVTPTPTPRTHVVEAGQSLYYIARQYQVSIEEIVALNHIEDSRILRVGQVLIVPDSPISQDVEGHDLPPQIIHIIQPGETLSGLSYEYDTPIDAIIAANPDVNMDLIYEGQEIIIPLSMPTPTPTATPAPTATPTATPYYVLPNLLAPADNAELSDSVLLFNWTATGWLADDEFYVLQLTWPDGLSREFWTKSNSQRITAADYPPGPLTWSVSIRQQTGVTADGLPVGETLTTPGKTRTVTWSHRGRLLDDAIRDYLVDNVGIAGFDGTVFCAFDPLVEIEVAPTFEVYAWVLCQEYDESLTLGSGVSVPVALALKDEGTAGFVVVSHQMPRDGTLYENDVQAIFPETLWPAILSADVEAHNQRVQALERKVLEAAEDHLR